MKEWARIPLPIRRGMNCLYFCFLILLEIAYRRIEKADRVCE